MKISNLQLQAFYQCSQTLNVGQAAIKLGLTQSALSQRLAALENDLEITLFVRDPKGLILTVEGEKLLRYAEAALGLEDEILQELKDKDIGGVIRIAGYSSVMRSYLQPKIASFARKHPQILLDLQTFETKELPQVLSSSRADFILLDYSLNKKGIFERHLFDEEYVVIDSAKYNSPEIYLDHDHDDQTTFDFFKFQGKEFNFKRSFLDDVYGLIQGVEEGVGKAVMSRHLVEGNKKIKILKFPKKFLRPVILHYYERPYYSKLHKTLLNEILLGN